MRSARSIQGEFLITVTRGAKSIIFAALTTGIDLDDVVACFHRLNKLNFSQCIFCKYIATQVRLTLATDINSNTEEMCPVCIKSHFGDAQMSLEEIGIIVENVSI